MPATGESGAEGRPFECLVMLTNTSINPGWMDGQLISPPEDETGHPLIRSHKRQGKSSGAKGVYGVTHTNRNRQHVKRKAKSEGLQITNYVLSCADSFSLLPHA